VTATSSSPISYSPEPQSLECASVPVLALGGGLTLIGVMRSLGPAGMPFYTVCEDHDFVMRSRWYHPPPAQPDGGPEGLADFLHWLPFDQAVLMPCTDEWLRAVSRLPKALARQFPSSIGAASVIETMTDKWHFAQLLESTGVPHPETLLFESYDEMAAVAPHNLQNKILKPLFSATFARKHGVKGYFVQGKADALRVAVALDYPILLQDYIPGPPTANVFIDGFVDRNGRVCARFARRRLRMCPPRLGNSSFLTSIACREVEPAVKTLDKLLAATAYRGIFSAEFKYDMRDGKFKILEINARPWWYVEFASHCGVNVCSMAYRDALELPVEVASEYTLGRKCVLLPYDFRAFRNHDDDSLSLWSWIHSWIGAHGGLFSWTDPLPAITYGWRIVAGFVKHHFIQSENAGVLREASP